VLNVVPAELYLRHQQQTGLMMAHTTQVPSFVVGAELLAGRPNWELVFAIGKQLSYLRPEHFLHRVLTAPSQLRPVFFALIRLGQPDYPVPGADVGETDQVLKQLSGRMHPDQLEKLAILARELTDSGVEIDMNRWWTATELTATRVASCSATT